MSPPPEFLTPLFFMSCSGEAKNTAPMAARKQTTAMALPKTADQERTMLRVMPNVRVNADRGGRQRKAGLRECTAYLRPALRCLP
jgi:hypothetical protein